MRSLRKYSLDIHLKDSDQVLLGFALDPKRADFSKLEMCVVLGQGGDLRVPNKIYTPSYIPYAELLTQPALLREIRQKLDTLSKVHDPPITFIPKLLPCGFTWNVITDGTLYAINFVGFRAVNFGINRAELPKTFKDQCHAQTHGDASHVRARLARFVDFERGILNEVERHMNAEEEKPSAVQRLASAEFETKLRLEAQQCVAFRESVDKKAVSRLKAILAKHDSVKRKKQVSDPAVSVSVSGGTSTTTVKKTRKRRMQDEGDETEDDTVSDLAITSSVIDNEDIASNHATVASKHATMIAEAASIVADLWIREPAAVDVDTTSVLVERALEVPLPAEAPAVAQEAPPVEAPNTLALASAPPLVSASEALVKHSSSPLVTSSNSIKPPQASPSQASLIKPYSTEFMQLDTPAETLLPILSRILHDISDSNAWGQLIRIPVFARLWKSYWRPATDQSKLECEAAIRVLAALIIGPVSIRPPIALTTIAALIRGCPLIRWSYFTSNPASARDIQTALEAGDPTKPEARKAFADLIERHATDDAERDELKELVTQRLAAWPPKPSVILRSGSIRALLNLVFNDMEDNEICNTYGTLDDVSP